MSIDQVIAISGSIGTCLSALATFLTVRQIAKQRQDSYRPQLALSQVQLECTKVPMTGGHLPILCTKQDQDDGTEEKIRTLALPLQNVGLGAAKGVSLAWSFPIADVVTSVNELAQRTLTPAHFSYQDGMLNLKSEGIGSRASMWRNQMKTTFDYILPAAVQSEPRNVILPDAYVFLCSAICSFCAKETNSEAFSKFPVLRAEFEYRDIGEQLHHTAFDIHFHLIALGSGGYPVHGFLECLRTA